MDQRRDYRINQEIEDEGSILEQKQKELAWLFIKKCGK